MKSRKYRIPRATKAALLLGGAACGSGGDDPPGGSTEGINVSSSRINAISKAYCEQWEECLGEDFDYSYDSQAECVDGVAENLAELSNEECLDAVLDYYSCQTQLACDEFDHLDEKCGDFAEAFLELCRFKPEEYVSVGVSSAKRTHHPVRKYRIPR